MQQPSVNGPVTTAGLVTCSVGDTVGSHPSQKECRDAGDLSAILRCFRQRRLWTQAMLAERSGVPEKTISSLETGTRRRPHLSTLDLLAAALDLDAEDRAALRQTPPTPRVRASGSLPTPPTSFIGRERDVRQLHALLDRPEIRLVTLVGVGGIGKTRLALRVATQRAATFTDGAAFVDLSSLSDYRLAPSAIAQALALPLQVHHDIEADVLAFCRDKHLLLVLDNAERVLEARTFVDRLLAASPRLTALVTSRERLGLQREYAHVVEPLATPQLASTVSMATYASYEAVTLMVRRTQAVVSSFALTEANVRPMADLCRRLDGIPLAIELAAARMPHFGTPHALVEHLDHRLSILVGGASDREERHRTMRAAIDWSYSELRPQEQALFQCLAMASGGFRLDAIKAICEPDHDVSGAVGSKRSSSLHHDVHDAAILTSLFSLIDKNLVQHVENSAGGSRYVMLETIREFALEQRAQALRNAGAAQRHAAHFLQVAERGEAALSGNQQAGAITSLKEEQANMRAAFHWQLAHQDTEQALRLGSALWQFWAATGQLREGRDWLEQALALPDSTAPEARTKALLRLGNFAIELADYPSANLRYAESHSLAEEHGDLLGAARALGSLGFVAWNQGRYADARRAQEASLRIWQEQGAQRGIAVTLQNLGNIALAEMNLAASRSYFMESLRLREAMGDEIGVAYASNWLAALARLEGKDAEASVRLDRAITIFRRMSDQLGEAHSLHELGAMASGEGRYATALANFKQSLRIRQEAGDIQGSVDSLEGIAAIVCAVGRHATGARLFGAAEAWRSEHGAPALPHLREGILAALHASQEAMGSAAFTLEWDAGLATPVDRAAEMALAFDVGPDSA